MSTLLDKVNQLQLAINELNSRYHIVATELANLKSRPNNESIYKQTISQLENRLASLTHEFDELNDVHTVTANKTQELITQNNKLNKKIDELTAENTLLQQKNLTAIQRAELVQEWLKNIDNGTA